MTRLDFDHSQKSGSTNIKDVTPSEVSQQKKYCYDSTYTRYLVKLETEVRTAVARGWGREKWVRGVQSCGDQLHKKVNIMLLSCTLKNGWNSGWLYFLGSKITAESDCSHEIKRRLLLGRKVMTNLDSILKIRDIYIVNKGLSSQGYGFSSGPVWMWELDYKESWTPKNWCFWTVVLEKTWESLGLQGDPTSPS